MNETDVTQIADDLAAYANHFEHRDWNYSRDLGFIKRIVRKPDPLRQRISLMSRSFFGKQTRLDNLLGATEFKTRLRIALLHLNGQLGGPDGTLDGGCIVTYWEETGEYLQFVQPSVGALIADWLKAEPSNPHAIKVAAEMARIQSDYSNRITADAYENGE